MNNIIEEGEGLESLLGEMVIFFCMNYIYTGKLTGITNNCVLLENPLIVYETGSFDEPAWETAQLLPHELYISIGSIESFGKMK